ncbi:hypothetical protein CLCR_07603 [Cladophialophora carrionii]|uniref:Uncharacterized protein n=1 Tax=Cladophialophora carrionii TaxID=86049 RepID=A0A1C1CMQ2_9EURO|nr:hypothetical protein CLCR_07603 [Cladophialophora carrionii]
MSITRGSLQCIATRLVISPPPATLGESTAVLKRLQSFGHVASFTASPRLEMPQPHRAAQNEQLEMTVLFSSRETLERAQTASPFTVRVNHHLPDPRVEDPYNVRNLQSRKQPQPKTMVCRLDHQDAGLPSGQNILSAGFSPSVQTRLYQSLTDLSPPEGMAAALGVFHNDSSSIEPTPELVDRVPDLTEMYLSRPSDLSTRVSGIPASTESTND